ncbi:MAG: hypothetical protein WC829_04340 [Hyphomicrobium sp.]
MAELQAMTPQQRDAAAYAEWNIRVGEFYIQIADKRAQADRYRGMRARVERWAGAPEGLKEFMLQQLDTSLEFDCDETYYTPPKRLDLAQWYRGEVHRAVSSLEYHGKERATEIARTAERNAWLAQLWASLPPGDK